MKPIPIRQPYKPTGTAGLDIEEWLELTATEQATAHIRQMEATAQQWAHVQWRESMGVPATVPADAQTLLTLCEQALAAIHSGDDSAMLLAMKATAQAAELNRWVAIDSALKLQGKITGTKSAGGKAAGALKAEAAEITHSRIVELWNASNLPEHNRASVIADRLGIKAQTVRRHVKKANLR